MSTPTYPPLPWRADCVSLEPEKFEQAIVIYSSVEPRHPVSVAALPAGPASEDAADLICRAVNEHADLQKAVRLLTAAVDDARVAIEVAAEIITGTIDPDQASEKVAAVVARFAEYQKQLAELAETMENAKGEA